MPRSNRDSHVREIFIRVGRGEPLSYEEVRVLRDHPDVASLEAVAQAESCGRWYVNNINFERVGS